MDSIEIMKTNKRMIELEIVKNELERLDILLKKMKSEKENIFKRLEIVDRTIIGAEAATNSVLRIIEEGEKVYKSSMAFRDLTKVINELPDSEFNESENEGE